MPQAYQSWGRYPPQARQTAVRLRWRDEPLPSEVEQGASLLPYGNGRSYGDSCLNDGGVLLDTRGLDRFIRFDTAAGLLCCESGVLLSTILDFIVPRGWFLPVTPGTKYVTVGGAIANDVHGKGHHRQGTFGCHVRRFELLRSNGSRLVCSPHENGEWFRATIGGLGLTGVIVWAEIALKRIVNPHLDCETVRCRNLEEFLDLFGESDRDYEYTVGWLDCLARGASLGRGLLMRANHAGEGCPIRPRPPRRLLSVPAQPPVSLVNGLTLRVFNRLYYHRYLAGRRRSVVHYERFFYPLDSICDWNRIYGPRGFLQYQCVVPVAERQEPVRELLRRIAIGGTGSFLTVLKVFGDRRSPGLLSFPRPGVTLALDFPNKGQSTLRLLESLDEIVRQAGGAVYPAKDARMSAESFRHYYPDWKEMRDYVDPRFSSSFWRRVTQGEPCARS